MLTLLYHDEDIAIIAKPAGLLVHRSTIDFHERQNAVKMLRNQIGQHVYPTHRLDKATSGVLIFALNQPAAQAINIAFDERQVKKTYIGLARGYTEPSGSIDYPLTKKRDKMSVVDDSGNEVVQEAQTEFTRLATAELPFPVGRYPTARYSLIEMRPLTGRRHQLRRHMKHIFHPLVGDTTYGDGRHNTFFRDHFQSNRLFLHCQSMTFRHPTTAEDLTVNAPLDTDVSTIFKKLGW